MDHKTIVALKGTLASLGARGIGFLFILFATPMLLDYLGLEGYGVWCLVTQLIGFAGFSDLGIGNGLLNELIYSKNERQAKRYIVSAFYMLSMVTIVLIIIAGALKIIPFHLVYQSKYSPDFLDAAIVFLFIFSISLPFSIIQKIQLANLHAFRVHVFEILEKSSSLFFTVLGIKLKLAFTSLFLVFYIPTFLAQISNLITYKKFCYAILLIKLEYLSAAHAKNILRTGKQFLLLSVIYALTRASDSYLIALVADLATVSDYQLPGRIFEIAAIMAQLPAWSLWSTIGHAIKNNERDWIIRTQIRAVILVLLVGGILIVPMLFYGNEILSAWLHRKINYSVGIYQSYAVYTILFSLFTILSSYLNVRNYIYQQCLMLIAFGAVGIPLKLYLLHEHGLPEYIYGNSLAFMFCVFVPTLIFIKKDLYDRKSLSTCPK